jgi:hypothetical protein
LGARADYKSAVPVPAGFRDCLVIERFLSENPRLVVRMSSRNRSLTVADRMDVSAMEHRGYDCQATR